MFNTKCPYTLKPISAIDCSREHIIPDALGGPNGFALNADAKVNSAFGNGVDGTLINQPLMLMKASQAGVRTHNGAVVVKLQGTLVSDGSPTDIRIFEDGQATFRSRIPVVKEPTTGEVIGVRGYGEAAQQQVDALRAGHARKGRAVVAGKPVVGDSTTNVQVKHDLAADDQGLGKIAYLTAVWTLGDAFIDTPTAAAFRKLIFGPPTREAIDASGVRVLRDDGSGQPIMPRSAREHHLICAITDGMLVVHVTLFCESLFTRSYVAPLAFSDSRRAILVSASDKTFQERSDLLPL